MQYDTCLNRLNVELQELAKRDRKFEVAQSLAEYQEQLDQVVSEHSLDTFTILQSDPPHISLAKK
jgi:hypothetical protein